VSSRAAASEHDAARDGALVARTGSTSSGLEQRILVFERSSCAFESVRSARDPSSRAMSERRWYAIGTEGEPRRRVMKKPMRVVLVAIGLTLAVSACRGKSEAERKAAEEQKAQEANLTAAKMQAEADEAKLKAAHEQERMKLQKEMDAHDRKASYLKAKAAKQIGATKKNADAAITELDARHAAAKASLGKLMDDKAPDWDASKKTAEDDVAAVGKSVDALERTLSKK
jgi:hypothetical protein